MTKFFDEWWMIDKFCIILFVIYFGGQLLIRYFFGKDED